MNRFIIYELLDFILFLFFFATNIFDCFVQGTTISIYNLRISVPIKALYAVFNDVNAILKTRLKLMYVKIYIR